MIGPSKPNKTLDILQNGRWECIAVYMNAKQVKNNNYVDFLIVKH